jgi:hypothetical protein
MSGNTISKYIPYQLDRIRNVRLSLGALSLAEETLNKSLSQVVADGMRIKQTATILWAGMQHEDKELTPDKVIELIDEYSSLPEANEMLFKALPIGEKSKNPNRAQRRAAIKNTGTGME